MVKEHTGRWHVPLPQLQVLRTALSCFSQCTVSFPSDCETVHCVLSSFALSFFELLLYFGKEEFLKDPLRGILDTFQECHSHLVRHRNAYLLLVSKVIQGGGPWEHPVLQAILKESPQPQEEVDKYLSSECPIFFELRVRYLVTCGRVQEAVALAKCCITHPEVGKHLYFHQAYLTCLWKSSHYDHLYNGIAMIDGRDAVEIICNSENEEKDDLLLALCKAFLTRQLQTGDMYYLWDLIFIWSKLHLRLDSSKQNFLGECHELMMNATNVRSIFPFIKIIRAELGSEGLEFCVELCARALQMDLWHDPVTASLIYKTIAYLLPTDLEICRACALLVFFQERTVESYKMAYLLYLHPDQEYHVDCSVIKNHMRFELLQILKKGLYFDPEFWNLITLRKNCLKLMNEKVMKAALTEIMEEDKWIPKFYGKEPYKLHYDTSEIYMKKVERSVNCRRKTLTKRIVVPPDVTVVSHVKKRGRKPGSRVIRVVDDSQFRQSERPCDVAQEKTVHFYNSRDLPELVKNDRNALKRRGRKPRWLLQQAAVEAEKRSPKQPECLDDKTLLLAMDFKKPECTTSEMGEEMEKASKSSLEQAENTLSKPDKTASDTPLEAALPSALPKTENPLLTHRCRLCNEELRGGNIMRHAVAHLQKDKLKCIFCGMLFNRRLIAKRHVVEHIDKLKISSNNVRSVEKRTTESVRCMTQSLPPKGKHKNKSATGMQLRASSRKRKCHHEPQHFNTTKSSSPEKAGRLLRNGSVSRRVSRREAYCCPADGCGRTFLRKGLLVIRHAMKSHPRDIKVQEYAFQWRKGKCEFCQRQFKSLQHYQDHAKMHEHSLKHVCCHHDCKDRFKTNGELRDHMKSHQPLQVQCGFAGCFQRFRQLSRLHSHEQKHYVPPETKNKSSKTPPGKNSVRNEGKQKRFQDPRKPGHSTRKGPTMAKTDGKTDTENTAEVKHKKAGDASLPKSMICGTSVGQLANGHATHEHVVPAARIEAKAGNSQECNQETRERHKIKPEINEGPQEHPTQGEKRVKSEDQSPYGRMSNKPFVRPPPTAYLDEKFISMPKRSKSLADLSSSQEHNICRDVSQRQRCPKCFSSFLSAEALQSHLSSDKCTSLFGFDSDEE
ncbi:hypothetical protein Z043_103017, partial [Scleropages formosus]